MKFEYSLGPNFATCHKYSQDWNLKQANLAIQWADNKVDFFLKCVEMSISAWTCGMYGWEKLRMT